MTIELALRRLWKDEGPTTKFPYRDLITEITEMNSNPYMTAQESKDQLNYLRRKQR